MNTTYSTIPLTEELLKSYMRPKIIAVRLFFSPHFWYAGILSQHQFEEKKLIINLEKSIRFERQLQKEIAIPGNSLVKVTIDRSVVGTGNKVLTFTLTEPEAIIHPVFEAEHGIIGIQHTEGFSHLSYRGPDLISIHTILNGH